MNHQAVIDGALFEPWLWLTPTDVKRLPEVIPTQDRTLFANDVVRYEGEVIAAVAGIDVAVVALFGARLQPVAAEHIHARVRPDRDGRLGLASGAAAIARDLVVVVAAFSALDHIVAANGERAVALRRTGETGLDLAAGVAAVTAGDVAVVALLDAALQAVAAARDARSIWSRADPAGSEHAIVAAVSGVGVGVVVALLTRFHSPVAAGWLDAGGGAEADAGITRFLLAGSGAALVELRWVALLTSLNDAVTAERISEAHAGLRASPTGLHLARCVATTADHRWVAGLVQLDDAVAADRGGCDGGHALTTRLAAVGAGGIANFARLNHAVATGDAGNAGAGLARAVEKRLFRASCRAAVAAVAIGVVALLGSPHQAIATNRQATVGVAAPTTLDGASARAAIATSHIVVVAGFVRSTHAVAAHPLDARGARRAIVAGLELTLLVTTVTSHRRQVDLVVALFTALTHPVAALRHGHARLARPYAGKAALDRLAIGSAAVARFAVTVVAQLRAFEDSVAANHDLHTAVTNAGAVVVEVHLGAVGRAAVSLRRVAIVTNLARLERLVATDSGPRISFSAAAAIPTHRDDEVVPSGSGPGSAARAGASCVARLCYLWISAAACEQAEPDTEYRKHANVGRRAHEGHLVTGEAETTRTRACAEPPGSESGQDDMCTPRALLTSI